MIIVLNLKALLSTEGRTLVDESLPVFELERWQSLRENYARILLSESGVEPLTIAEINELIGEPLFEDDFRISYGWTKGSPELRKTISEMYRADINEENILVTNGSSEANLLTVLSTIKKGDLVIAEMPNYMQIYNLLKWKGAKIIEAWRKPEENFRLNLNRLINNIRRLKPKAIFITNPNNPTGMFLSNNEVNEIYDEASKVKSIIIFDEVYRGLEHEGRVDSLIEIGDMKNVIVTSGLSKAYGLPGLRIGWIIAEENLIMKMWSIKDYTSIAPSRLSDSLATRCLRGNVRNKLLERGRGIVRRNKEILGKIANDYKDVMKVYYPLAGAYFIGKFTWSNNSNQICERLFKEYGVLICPGETFKLKGFARIGMGQSPEKYENSLKAMFNGLKEIKKEETNCLI